MVRAAVVQALPSHQGLCRDHAEGAPPRRAGDPRGSGDSPALYRRGRSRRRQAVEGDPAHEAEPPDRKSVVSGKRVSVRVELGVRRTSKQKKSKTTSEYDNDKPKH